MDSLHEKIRKQKNPSMIHFGILQEHLPKHLLEEEGSFIAAYGRFCRELMDGLKGEVPAVRFGFDDFALLGPDGLLLLSKLLQQARQDFYVVLDAPGIHSPWAAERTAKTLFGSDEYPCDALVISPYIGSDSLKPFVSYCKDQGKDVFVVVRSANKSASDLQDLYTGSRLVQNATADIVNRFGENILCRCGYSRMGAVVSAGAANSIRNLRSNYKGMYFLVDGLDYPSGNHKNCSHAFDRFGYGAVVCAGPSVTAAWLEGETDGREYVVDAVHAAQRMKKNLTRYVTIL